MTSTGTDLLAPGSDTSYRRPRGVVAIVHDGWIITWRNLVQLPRTPALIVFTLVQPVMFVVLFNYVFGGAIGSSLPPG